MTRRTTIAFAVAAALWLAAAWPAFAQPVAPNVPQTSAVDRQRAAVNALEAERTVLLSAKKATRASYAGQTKAIAGLKRQRRSWRRDRALRKAMAVAQTTAAKLAGIDADLRAVDKKLRAARRALVVAIDAELAGAPTASRRASLVAWRRAAQRRARPRAKKIVMPDATIDPLATVDELSDQSALMKKTEADLAREERLLARREDRYARMARLQKQRSRADELDVFDDSRPRRNTGRLDLSNDRGAGGAGAETADDSAGDPAPAPPDGDSPDSPGLSGDSEPEAPVDSDPTVVLADVVDADTLAAMRRAERGNDPAAKARAAARMREQVRTRRERLARQRAKVEQRIRALQSADR